MRLWSSAGRDERFSFASTTNKRTLGCEGSGASSRSSGDGPFVLVVWRARERFHWMA